MNSSTILTSNANNATDIHSALKNAGMDWSVETKPIQTANGWTIHGKFATVRSDKTGPDAVLGVVGSKYTVIQNADALGILDDVIAADPDRKAVYDSVLSLNGGARVAASVKLNSFEVVPGDTHDNYLTAITSHDGSSGTKLMIISFRMACFNATLRAVADAKSRGTFASISHTISAANRLAIARKALFNSTYSIDELQTSLRELAARKVNRETMTNIMDRLFPIAEGDLANPATTRKIENKRTKFLELFESNDDGAVKLISGTAYNAYNAFTEYVDHHQRVIRTNAKTGMQDYEIRQERALFGNGATEKEIALNAILEATKFAPKRSLPFAAAATASFDSNSSLLHAIITN